MVLLDEMKDREEARGPSYIPELIRQTKCELKTCENYSHNCLVLLQQKHVSLSANDFATWAKAIEDNKATLDVPPLSVRGVPVSSKKSKGLISNVQSTSFNRSISNGPNELYAVFSYVSISFLSSSTNANCLSAS